MGVPETPDPGPQRPAGPRRIQPAPQQASGCAKGALWSLIGALVLLAVVFVFILAVCSR
jgi:hypothetical protein